MTSSIKEPLIKSALKSCILWHSTQQFHHLSHMIIILTIILSFPRLKEEVSSCHLEHHASQGPHIG